MEFLYIVAAAVIGFGLGWWVKSRTVAGIQSDYNDAIAQINRLTGKKSTGL